MSKEPPGIYTEITFLRVQAYSIFAAFNETLLQVFNMVFLGAIYGKVVQKDLHKFVEIIGKDLHHTPLEGGWCTHQSKRHHSVCECSILGDERGFQLVFQRK